LTTDQKVSGLNPDRVTATKRIQLENFSQALQLAAKSPVALAIPANWLQAFMMLDTYINTLPSDKQ
jgi:hypothetical protein